MAVEIVLLVPVLMGFILLIVMGGRYVAVRGDIDAAARDAARAASLSGSASEAGSAARSTVAASLDDDTTCAPALLGGEWAAGAELTVTLQCQVSLAGLGLLGVPGSVSVSADSTVPLDPFRSYE